MSADFESKTTFQGLTFKLYRGEGAALLAFDLAPDLATPDFVGFSIEVRYPGASHWGVLHNRLHFDYPPVPERPRTFPSTEAPFQKFRWVHVPSDILPGHYRYRVTACYMRADGTLNKGVAVEGQVSLEAQTISQFLNIGFTRGFASSQAYGDRFDNETRILPPSGSAVSANLELDMAPFEAHYRWLGFEARQLILDVLEQAAGDPELTLDALMFESKEPDILRRLEQLGPRLRTIIDDSARQKPATSCESLSAQRLAASGAQVKRMHFSGLQHHKVLIVRRAGKAVRVLGGSTNFALRGLYVQANNVLLFDDESVAGKFGEVFEAYWRSPGTFRQHPLSQQWWVVRDQPGSKVSLCFAPHADSALSLDPIATSIEQASSSVLYSIAFLNQINGKVRAAFDELMQRALFSYGVAQRTGKLAVRKPDGSVGLLPFAYLASNAPAPFRSEWSGNAGNMLHNKFVVTDFNGANPTVYTGSSNLAEGGEQHNGDHLVRIEDRKVAVVYAIEALRLFDHFHFRVNASQPGALRTLRLAKPPAAGGKTWFDAYYRPGHVKARDRELFVK